MSIKCGHCPNRHDTVAEVRACAGAHPGVEQPSQVTGDMITTKQLGFLNKLRVERGLAELPADVRMTKREASSAINDQLNTPVSSPEMAAWKTADRHSPQDFVAAIPAGYYATLSATGHNDLDFWLVQDGKGKWQGRQFVKRYLGGQGPIQISRAEQAKALRAIADAGADKAAVLFGKELGRCYKCGRSLTDETSRQLGVGPDCRSRAA